MRLELWALFVSFAVASAARRRTKRNTEVSTYNLDKLQL